MGNRLNVVIVSDGNGELMSRGILWLIIASKLEINGWWISHVDYIIDDPIVSNNGGRYHSSNDQYWWLILVNNA